jgi:predicted nuclease of restriction endonuclease-like (RecB) superfamily
MEHHSSTAASHPSLPKGYLELLDGIKREVVSARVRTALAVNTEMIALYWRIGRMILDAQQEEGWGTKVVQRLSVDLRTEYPQVKGLSSTNLRYMQRFAAAWPEICPQPVGKIPWGHIRMLLDNVDEPETRSFYAQRVIEGGWSRGVLTTMIKTQLHLREGAAPSSFPQTVPIEEREAIRGMVRDPYVIDWIGGQPQHERDLEDRLCARIVQFLQELGQGFAFVGRQYMLLVNGNEFFVDLLFYHLKLRRYVVIELKTAGFIPEHVGKLSFYVNVVNAYLRDEEIDQPTIGILLVAARDDVVVEFSLQTTSSPIAVSNWSALPPEVKAVLPSQEDFTRTLSAAFEEGEGADMET